ncbi:hypothetical protein CRG98_008825 [Punica granatum]|uniref:Uncharacterized protein n=1 Tax=Punica granatum TaxID=22663 RepID=A0A2I0KQL7_PUNGR|nr:hypothetical protein CRG98_008825 [Punica granatum]
MGVAGRLRPGQRPNWGVNCQRGTPDLGVNSSQGRHRIPTTGSSKLDGGRGRSHRHSNGSNQGRKSIFDCSGKATGRQLVRGPAGARMTSRRGYNPSLRFFTKEVPTPSHYYSRPAS